MEIQKAGSCLQFVGIGQFATHLPFCLAAVEGLYSWPRAQVEVRGPAPGRLLAPVALGPGELEHPEGQAASLQQEEELGLVGAGQEGSLRHQEGEGVDRFLWPGGRTLRMAVREAERKAERKAARKAVRKALREAITEALRKSKRQI